MTITLPVKPEKALSINSRRMCIFANPKIGKTSNILQLPNALLIDMEDASDNYDGLKINVKKIARETGESILAVVSNIAAELKKSETKYDFIMFDSATAMEDLAKELAATNYRASLQGKSWEGTDIYDLPKGKGYGLVRNTFKIILEQFDGLATKCFILTAHVKLASMMKKDESIEARDINLTGKLRFLIASAFDSIGHLYRDDDGITNILSFKAGVNDVMTGSWIDHLNGQEFELSKKENGVLTTYWDKIFI